MRVFFQAPTDEQFSSRYDGVGAGTKRNGSSKRFNDAEQARTQPAVDRQKQQVQDATRNVRVGERSSSMPGTPKNTSFDEGRRDIATEFNKSYEKAGIQPSSLDERGNSDTPQRRRYEAVEQISRSEARQAQQQAVVSAPPPAQPIIRTKKRKRVSKTKKAAGRVRATAANIWIFAWGTWFWLFFQLPIALLSLLFLALTEAIHVLYMSATQIDGGDGWLVRSVKQTFSTLARFAEWIATQVLSIWGIDLAVFSPASFAMMTYMLTIVLGWFTLMLIFFVYKINFLHCLSGQKAGLKIGMFALAFVGYCIPFVNMFPLYGFWMASVWMWPK